MADAIRLTAEEFLSTLPARGATVVVVFKLVHLVISIHAPREGSDDLPRTMYFPFHYFYPRSPRGERRHRRADCGQSAGHFYPRSPRGERLSSRRKLVLSWGFLSTLPARGATRWQTRSG